MLRHGNKLDVLLGGPADLSLGALTDLDAGLSVLRDDVASDVWLGLAA